VSACGGPASSIPAADNASQQSHVTRPSVGSSATPSPIPFVYQNVDSKNSNHNQVNGINQLGTIVGTWGGGQGSTIDESYDAKAPYPKLRALNYPGAQGTFAAGLSSNFIRVGYVIDPGGLGGIWGFVKIRGLWTLLQDPNQGTGSNAVTEIWGVNDSQFAVGFYVNSAGTDVPIEVNVPSESFTELQPPGAIGGQATGIDGKGDLTGWETTSNGVEGFFLKAGTYYPFAESGAKATYALSLNWQDQIVGDYIDAAGATHGFVMTGPTRGSSQQVWQTIDEPNAAHGTWVTGINNHEVICGYYIDAKNVQHGFVAAPQ